MVPLASIKRGANSWYIRITANTLTSKVEGTSSKSTSSAGTVEFLPAFLAKMPNHPPVSSSTCLLTALTLSGLSTSRERVSMPSGRRPEIVRTLRAVAKTRRLWINQDQPRAARAGGNGRGPLENSRARAWPVPPGLQLR